MIFLSVSVQSAVKKTKGAAAASTSTKRAAARQAKTSSPEEVELSEEERPMKRRRKISSEEEEEEAAPSKTVEYNCQQVAGPFWSKLNLQTLPMVAPKAQYTVTQEKAHK